MAEVGLTPTGGDSSEHARALLKEFWKMEKEAEKMLKELAA